MLCRARMLSVSLAYVLKPPNMLTTQWWYNHVAQNPARHPGGKHRSVVEEEKKMSANTSAQELLIQLETALHRLVESFWEEPYRYFTESDAITALQSWFVNRPALTQPHCTNDSFETGLLHREYPTFFRFRKSDPVKRLPKPARRGHHDLVLIDPAYVRDHGAETVTNRDIENCGTVSSPPLLAAVEFKFFARPWSSDGVRSVEQDLGKLNLTLDVVESPAYARAAYLCIFQRDTSPKLAHWNRHWPTVKKMLTDFPDIRSVVAVCWPTQKDREPFVHYGGPWITGETGEL